MSIDDSDAGIIAWVCIYLFCLACLCGVFTTVRSMPDSVKATAVEIDKACVVTIDHPTCE